MKSTNTRTYRVRTASGIWGWRSRLQVQHDSFENFRCFCDVYNNHIRLGYHSPYAAWEANSVIEGSTNPSDYRKVSV